MNTETQVPYRYFVSYSGIKLPLKLVNEISEAGLINRNTYYRGHFDSEGKMLQCQKIVYGEVESEHQYDYYTSGGLKKAQITEDDELRVINFNESGDLI
jgi:hypothetical protein